MATSVFKREQLVPVFVSSSVENLSCSTDWFYTGIYVYIPANCYYFVCGACLFKNSSCNELALSTSSDPSVGYANINKTDVAANGSSGGCTACGYTESSMKIYLHAKYNARAANDVYIKGGYIIKV